MILNIDSDPGSSQFVSISGHVSALTDINRDRKPRQYQNIFSGGGKIFHNAIPSPSRLIVLPRNNIMMSVLITVMRVSIENQPIRRLYHYYVINKRFWWSLQQSSYPLLLLSSFGDSFVRPQPISMLIPGNKSFLKFS